MDLKRNEQGILTGVIEVCDSEAHEGDSPIVVEKPFDNHKLANALDAVSKTIDTYEEEYGDTIAGLIGALKGTPH